jgi:hypothetical protein
MLESEKGTGRIIRVGKYGIKSGAVAYIIAIADPRAAIALIREKAAAPDEEVRDMGRVSDALLNSLRLKAGEYLRADSSRGAQPADTLT